MKRWLVIGLMVFASALTGRAALTFTLTPTVQPGTGTYAVVFSGTLSNTSSSAALFLNNIQVSFTGLATNYLGSITNSFFENVPGILSPGGSYSDVVFAVSVKRSTPTNTYSGTVTIQGGGDLSAATTLGSQSFQIAWLDSVGDGILDWWRKQYFGGTGTTTNNRSCASCDADGTGQKNLFKFVAGLNPTNSAVVFTSDIDRVPGSNQVTLIYGPAVSGRSYSYLSTTNLGTGSYAPLSAPTIQTNGNEITVMDSSATGSQRFYRVGISVP